MMSLNSRRNERRAGKIALQKKENQTHSILGRIRGDWGPFRRTGMSLIPCKILVDQIASWGNAGMLLLFLLSREVHLCVWSFECIFVCILTFGIAQFVIIMLLIACSSVCRYLSCDSLISWISWSTFVCVIHGGVLCNDSLIGIV